MTEQEQKPKPKPKRSFFDKIINVVCIVIIAYFVVDEFSHTFRTLDTIQSNSALYERHYSLSLTYPFIGSYFLMKPENYDPKYKYPLVVVLHGVSAHAYAAESLAQPAFRKSYPFFVMVPIAPKRAFWATPKDKAYRMVQYIPYPDHLPQVISGMRDIADTYSIDSSKTFIVGHSMGGSGVFGALERYPDMFTAGVASAGAWSPAEVSHINDPLLVFHGAQDMAVPVQFAKNFQYIREDQGVPIVVNIVNGHHGIGRTVSDQREVWDWLLNVTEIDED